MNKYGYENQVCEDGTGEIYLEVQKNYCTFAVDPADIADAMTAKDFEELIAKCGGRFDLLETNTARALSIKAASLMRTREERNAQRAENYRRRQEELHACIMDEIRMLCGRLPYFTTTQIQIEAARCNKVVRTRQMYTRHLYRALCEGEVVHLNDSYKSVNVIYANGKSGTQRILQKGAYKFK